MRQSACLVVNPITVNNFAVLMYCTPVGRGSDSMIAPTKKNVWLVGAGHVSVSWPIEVQLVVFFLLQCFSGVTDAHGISRCLNAL